MIEPKQCVSMAAVRAGVDALDEEIVMLLAKRFQFMDAAARIKRMRADVRDEARKAAVLDHVRSIAVRAGAPRDALVRLYEELIEASIAYELERFDGR